jgi:GH43 family beta-xylosidase
LSNNIIYSNWLENPPPPRWNLKNVPKSMKLKRGDIVTRVKGHLSVVCSKNKRDVYVLMNMHSPPVDGNSDMNLAMLSNPMQLKTTMRLWALWINLTGW